MKKLKLSDAKYVYGTNLSLVVYHGDGKILEGNKTSNPEIHQLLYSDKAHEYSYYIKYQRRYRFLKYLTGQVFISSFIALIFSLITLLFITILTLSNITSLSIIWLPLMTGMVSGLNYLWARKAKKRLIKSLVKYKK